MPGWQPADAMDETGRRILRLEKAIVRETMRL